MILWTNKIETLVWSFFGFKNFLFFKALKPWSIKNFLNLNEINCYMANYSISIHTQSICRHQKYSSPHNHLLFDLSKFQVLSIGYQLTTGRSRSLNGNVPFKIIPKKQSPKSSGVFDHCFSQIVNGTIMSHWIHWLTRFEFKWNLLNKIVVMVSTER